MKLTIRLALLLILLALVDCQAPVNSASPQPADPPSDATYANLLATASSFAGTNTDWTPQNWVFDDDPAGAVMVLVPPGCFLMGSEGGNDDERPVVEQCLSNPFWLDLTEVTNAAFGSAGCQDYSAAPDEPRDCVSWVTARDFCASRSARLPTELEWEYAARGPNGWIYPWGNDWDPTRANWSGVDPDHATPVGSYPTGASWVGALDMAGNLWEWAASAYRAYPYAAGDGRETPTDRDRVVLRGGSLGSRPFFLRAAERGWRYEDEAVFGFDDFGFRCARDP